MNAPQALLDRYLLDLDDDGKLDDTWAEGLFTSDAIVEFPHARHSGIAGMADWHRGSLEVFASTQHLGSPAEAVVDGDRATLRANLQSTHVRRDGPLFRTGTFVTGQARRTAGGWRLTHLSFRMLWMEGSPR